MSKKSTLRFFKIAITTFLLTYVFDQADLLSVQGWNNLIATFIHVNHLFLIVSLLIGGLTIFSSSLKWYMLVRSRSLKVSLWRLFGYYLVGKFFSLLLPTGFGGDVIRMRELGKYTSQYTDAMASVFIERFSGMITLIILALTAIFLNLRRFEQPELMVSLGVLLGGLAIIILWLIVDHKILKALRTLAERSQINILFEVLEKVDRFRQSVLAYGEKPVSLWMALLNSLVFYSLAIVNVWVTALAFEDDISLTVMILAVPIILLIMNLPISIGNIGLMEFAYSFIFSLFAVSPTVALSTVLFLRLKEFLFASLGGLWYGVSLSIEEKA